MLRGLESLSYEEKHRDVQPEEVKAPGRSHCSFSILKGGLRKRWGTTFYSGR